MVASLMSLVLSLPNARPESLLTDSRYHLFYVALVNTLCGSDYLHP